MCNSTVQNTDLDTIVNNDAISLQDNDNQCVINHENSQEKLNYKHELRSKVNALRYQVQKHVKRVKGCGCNISRFVNLSPTVDVALNGSNTYYKNLQSCNSVWSCPSCSQRISEERAKEVREICTNAQKKGYKLAFFTLTVPHKKNMPLSVLKEGVAESYRQLTRNRGYRDKREKYGVEGYIRGLETTFTERNGWHPHLHVLFFFKPSEEDTHLDFCDQFFNIWSKQIKKAGLGKCSKDAYKVKEVFDNQGISEYITKWDLSKELTQGHTKKKAKSWSVFGLMEEYKKTGNKFFLNKFLEFTNVFHGARQLTYSRGLKKSFLEPKEKEENTDITLFGISLELWYKIVEKQQQAQILNIFEKEYSRDNDIANSLIQVNDFLFDSIGCIDVEELDDKYVFRLF